MNVRVSRPQHPNRSALYSGVDRVVGTVDDSGDAWLGLLRANGDDLYLRVAPGGLDVQLDHDGGAASLE